MVSESSNSLSYKVKLLIHLGLLRLQYAICIKVVGIQVLDCLDYAIIL